MDLRLPALAMGMADQSTDRFPSFTRRELNMARAESEGPGLLATSAATANNEHAPTRVEVFARKFQREGLPVARLWENKSALVHVGLNQKGKPGLWIVQKVH